MAGREDLIAAFDAERAYLVRVAYGTLGSIADAEDVVQEAGVRLLRAPRPDEIDDLRAWLTRVVGRLALDALRRSRRAREEYVGEWLPEPIVEDPVADPADRVTLSDSVSMALMVVLERLSPAERTAFVLHDVFGVSFDEIAEIVGRSPAAVRQLAARARRHVTDGRPRYAASAEAQRRVVQAFALACAEGDLVALLATLEDEVIWRSDGGGNVSALRKPLRGRDRVAKALLGFARRAPLGARFALVNGHQGLVLTDADGILTVMSFTLADEKIVAIASIRNPRKLTHVPPL
jgi:RNA polymerase sigma-70 factor (ECF subfamily)